METRSWKKINSKYLLSQIFDILMTPKMLNIIRYNKGIQKKLKRKLLDYKNEYEKIVIEIIPKDNEDGEFINFPLSKKSYYHIYFDDNNKMIDRNFIKKDEKVSKIKIIIDNKVKSFYQLFTNCKCIKRINFIKFNRNNIGNMNKMFKGCSSLENIDFSDFNTDNVIKMNSMFDGCSSLKELNLSNFNTSNVVDMRSMFNRCSSLKELNLSNFNTDRTFLMFRMFSRCSSLKTLNISNFNIEKTFMYYSMFDNCKPEKIICSDEFKKKMKNSYPDLFISE